MNLNPDFYLLQINWLNEITAGKASLVTDFRLKLNFTGFYMIETPLSSCLVTPLPNFSKSLSEIIFIVSDLIKFLKDNKVMFIPGKVSFSERSNCGFLVVRYDHILLLTVYSNGQLSTTEYPLTYLKT